MGVHWECISQDKDLPKSIESDVDLEGGIPEQKGQMRATWKSSKLVLLHGDRGDRVKPGYAVK